MDAETLAYQFGRLLSGRDDGFALWMVAEQLWNVGRPDDEQIFVGSRILGSDDGCRRIVNTYFLRGQKLFDSFFPIGFLSFVDKFEFVVEKTQSENAPHIIGVVGVKELHAPSVTSRWETAEHEQLHVRWCERG